MMNNIPCIPILLLIVVAILLLIWGVRQVQRASDKASQAIDDLDASMQEDLDSLKKVKGK